MEISEVRVKLVANKDDRLKAFCSITMDNQFVVRDIKVIEGAGGLFVAMPSRKMSDHCDKCGSKNHLRAKFCNNCGATLSENRAKKDLKGRMKLHADIAHPINAECRRRIQEKVIAAFKEEVEKSKQPGYKPVEMDVPDEDVPEIVS
ncbi:MAG: septation protein SpoVG family protein [Planctomycetota bacterium]|jgi:stage V sporulation protein G